MLLFPNLSKLITGVFTMEKMLSEFNFAKTKEKAEQPYTFSQENEPQKPPKFRKQLGKSQALNA